MKSGNNMHIYVALRYSDEPMSCVVGAFSGEKLAQDACQEDENDTAEASKRPPLVLKWEDAEALTHDGQYSVVLVDLNVRQ